jgi:hypothetical protein
MEWLPEIIPLSEHGGDFPAYLRAVYRVFRRDFVSSQPVFRSRRCFCDSRRDVDGMECGFWHIITDGRVEDERVPNMRRCERIAWPRAIIEASDSSFVRVWESDRKRPGEGRQSRISLAPADFSYVVVLKPTAKAYILVTAFYVENDYQREKRRREYERSTK